MNRFIMADASKCIGCRTCEVACVVSHQAEQDCASLTPDTFLPRIHVIKGVNISTAAICRQCEDAPCANVCPNGAIKREKGFVHVMQERCIGCKTCVVACPYGAMEVVVRPVVRNSGIGLSVRAEKAEANKCDLCYHRDAGPACMEACPTHALVCVDRDKLEQMSAENVAARRSTPRHHCCSEPYEQQRRSAAGARQGAGRGVSSLRLATCTPAGAGGRCLQRRRGVWCVSRVVGVTLPRD